MLDRQRTSATGGDHVHALDGLRGVAVALVVLFHFGFPGLQGGFFGVDVFYVLSGYLITGLLLEERALRGRIGVIAFWQRRARRLLPALLLLLLVVTLIVRFVEPAGTYPDYRMSASSALFYFSNWWQIANSSNYFSITGSVSPLAHTWSLAIEEQFYLVWPVVVLVVLRLSRTYKRGIKVLGALAAGGAIASATEMALLFRPGVDETRLYFGTDTHAQSVLVGAALACGFAVLRSQRGEHSSPSVVTSTRQQVLLTTVGLLGVAALAVAAISLSGSNAVTYEGGFLAVAVASAAVIVAAAARHGPVATALAVRPLRWLGTISYGVYLWHFPVSIFIDSARVGVTGTALFMLRVAITLALAQASYVLVERRVREGTFWRSIKAAVPGVAAVAAVAAMVVISTVPVVPAAAGPVRQGVLPRSEREALDSAGAFGRHPVRFLLVGDSLAKTLGLGLRVQSVREYGVDVISRAVIGCDFDTVPEIWLNEDLSPTTPCDHWKRIWAQDLAQVKPEVVGLLLGWWSVADRDVDGNVENITRPAWRAHLEAEYATAVHLLASRGAHVIVFTVPFFDAGNAEPGTSVWPEDEPSRVTELNQLIASVVRSSHGAATVFDLNHILDPSGRYMPNIDGMTVRWSDGIHITLDAGEWLQRAVLPFAGRLGLSQRSPTA